MEQRIIKTRLQLAIQAILLGAPLISAMSISPAAYANSSQQYNITANSLANVLQQFAIQSKLTLAYEPQSLTEQQSAGLNGSYTIEQGLQNILTPHGLQAVRLNNGGFSIQKIKNNQTHSNTTEIVQLNPITVTATPSSRVQQNNGNVQQLPLITVTAEQDGKADDGYLSKNITGVGSWGERSLQDTPYQISVISQDLIENTASGIDQIFKMNPIVQVTRSSTSSFSFNTPEINIRGLGASGNHILDGIPFSWVQGVMSEDVERIEILNGLSGFLYGVGYVGGAVNYVSKKPTQQRLANLSLGSTGNQAFYGHLDLGGKLDQNGDLSYRLNVFKQDGETSIKDQNLDKELISGALDWQVNNDFLVSLNASHKKIKVDKLASYFSSNASIDKLNLKQGYAPNWTFSDSTQDRLGFNTTWQINNYAKLRTGYIYLENENDMSMPFVYDNYDGTYSFNYYRSWPSKEKDHGAYIYTDLNFNTFGVEHNLTIGGSKTRFKQYGIDGGWEWINLGSFTLDQLNSVSEPVYLGNTNNQTYYSGSGQKTNITIGDDIKFNEKWSTLIGLNYAKVDKDNYSIEGKRTDGYGGEKVTPNISLLFKPFEDLTTYVTYMESLEDGVDVGETYANSETIFDPYVSKQYEIGAKYAISPNFLLSSALFRIEKANQYEDTSTIITEGKPTLTQDGKVIYQGVELTLTGKVTNNLTLVGGGTFLDLKTDKANENEGKKPTDTASKMAKLYAEYAIPAIEGLTLTGGAYYTGKAYRDGANTDIIPAYSVFDAGVRYATKIAQYPTTFILNATNITDKKYWRSSTSFGEPRNIAFAVKTQF
ncbi:TonB-dependent receptor [Acinetobacter puyangensis]|uniref:Iron complex outermembrane recepter protein n=1 Tax=Acinetobacter puyangensis TaxID=1096779 RepID=A0A240EAN3_9GAMM|nr:TonB-dependent receptor [Acinetobacter puyangensis]SNX45591.1 iron complex outermembrane recepter protein [Acinetobacter puyangensis]